MLDFQSGDDAWLRGTLPTQRVFDDDSRQGYRATGRELVE